MTASRKQEAERVDMDRLEKTFFQLLEADREGAGFYALFDECHRLIALALEAESRAAAAGGESAQRGPQERGAEPGPEGPGPLTVPRFL